jgi:uncharacterized membrane protein YgcG
MIQNSELWQKISSFNMDEMEGDYNFSVRLASENGWTKYMTEKAILEYKKFMYLAAISENKVSPSEIVDIVWHQHLIFTQSYELFCALLGRKIEHIPSTHNPAKESQFKQAMRNTQQLYRENFGNQPEEIWNTKDPLQSLEVKPYKLHKTLITLLVVIIMGALLYPMMIYLKPTLITIKSQKFLIGYIFLFGFLVIFLYLFNRIRFRGIISQLSSNSLINNLSADELIYLQRNSLAVVIQYKIDKLIKEDKIAVLDKTSLSVKNNATSNIPEEQAILNTIKNGSSQFHLQMKSLVKKPIFSSIVISTNSILNKIGNSSKATNVYIFNLICFLLFFNIGLSRLIIGLERGKPIIYISILLAIVLIIILFILVNFKKNYVKNSIVIHFRKKFTFEKTNAENTDWNYFLLGTMAISPLFLPTVTQYNRTNNTNSDGSTTTGTSCGSDGGSSCGGGGCGGCGGD